MANTVRFHDDHGVDAGGSYYKHWSVHLDDASGGFAEFDIPIVDPLDATRYIVVYFGTQDGSDLPSGPFDFDIATADPAVYYWNSYNDAVGGADFPFGDDAVAYGGTSDPTYSGADSGWSATVDPASDPGWYLHAPLPVITSLSPSTGVVGTAVVLAGSHLADVYDLRIDGITISYTIISDTEIDFTVPPGVSVGPVAVVASSPGGSGAPFTFTVVAPPTVTGYVQNIVRAGCALQVIGSQLDSTTGVKVRKPSGLVSVPFYWDAAAFHLVVDVPADAQRQPYWPQNVGLVSPTDMNLQITNPAGSVDAELGVIDPAAPATMWQPSVTTPVSLWADATATEIKWVTDYPPARLWVVTGFQHDYSTGQRRVIAQLVQDGGSGVLTAGPQVVVTGYASTYGEVIACAPIPGTDLIVVGWVVHGPGATGTKSFQVLQWAYSPTFTLTAVGSVHVEPQVTSPSPPTIGDPADGEWVSACPIGPDNTGRQRVVLFGGPFNPTSGGWVSFGYRSWIAYEVSSAGFGARLADGVLDDFYTAYTWPHYSAGIAGGALDGRYFSPAGSLSWFTLAVFNDNTSAWSSHGDGTSDAIHTVEPYYSNGLLLTNTVEYETVTWPGAFTGASVARLSPSTSAVYDHGITWADDWYGLTFPGGDTNWTVLYADIGVTEPATGSNDLVFLIGADPNGYTVAVAVDPLTGWAGPIMRLNVDTGMDGFYQYGQKWVPYDWFGRPQPAAPDQMVLTLSGTTNTLSGDVHQDAAVCILLFSELTVACTPFIRPDGWLIGAVGY